MKKRVFTGAVIFVITALFVYLKTISPYFFDGYVLIMSYGALYETIKAYKIANKESYERVLYLIPLALCAIFICDFSLLKKFLLLLFVCFFCFVAFLSFDIIQNKLDNKDDVDPKTIFEKTKTSLMILLYPTIVVSLMFLLNHINQTIGLCAIILAFAVTMTTDCFALFVGKALGKSKFTPGISPNKTIAGFVGGLIFGTIAGIACYLIFYFTNIYGFKTYFDFWNGFSTFALASLVSSYITQLGDLVASALKRKVGIKDYGTLFPGHGGFMDRIDGLMFSMAFLFVVFALKTLKFCI